MQERIDYRTLLRYRIYEDNKKVSNHEILSDV